MKEPRHPHTTHMIHPITTHKAHLGLGEAQVGADLQLGVALRPVQGQPPPEGDPVLEVQRLDALRPVQGVCVCVADGWEVG